MRTIPSVGGLTELLKLYVFTSVRTYLCYLESSLIRMLPKRSTNSRYAHPFTLEILHVECVGNFRSSQATS